MKTYFSKIIIFLGIFSLLIGGMTSFGMGRAYAVSLEVIGSDLGLEIVPSGTKLFDLTNLNPGDTSEEKIDIKNNYTSPFEVFMRTKRTSPQPQPGEADLFSQLVLTIYLDDVVIYTGPMNGYAQNNISLGKINPKNEKELRAIVHLPGAETGNEFQGKSLQVKWYFMAELDKPGEPNEPEEPGEPTEPNEPGEPTRPVQPSEPEVDEILEIDELIPEGIPEIPEEIVEIEEVDQPIPKAEPVKLLEKEPKEVTEEIIEEEVPQSTPFLPRTGQGTSFIFYILGAVLLGLGLGMRKKK